MIKEINTKDGAMMKVGEKIKFKEEKQRYTIQASNERFAICTKPINCQKTVLYTIVDFKEKIRGTDNMIFGRGYETKELCEQSLQDLITGEIEISCRNRVPLIIESIT